MTTEPTRAPPALIALARTCLRLAAIVALAWAMHRLIGWAQGTAMHVEGAALTGMLLLLLVAYALLVAVPFVPGVEIGLSLLAMEGAPIAPAVYCATLVGLGLAFCAGAWLPQAVLERTLADLRLTRAAALVETVTPLDREARLAFLHGHAPRWLRPFAERYRYIVLAALVNLPGNALIGGGGGILFLAGFSRLFQPGWMIVTMALAVLPVPLAMMLFDIHPLFGG
jgi:hypothetical protein